MFHSPWKVIIAYIILTIVLSSCSSIKTTDVEENVKRIELTDPAIWAYPRSAAFAHHETQMSMNVEAYKLCNNGFQKVREEYVENNGAGKDALIWDIRCIKINK